MMRKILRFLFPIHYMIQDLIDNMPEEVRLWNAELKHRKQAREAGEDRDNAS